MAHLLHNIIIIVVYLHMEGKARRGRGRGGGVGKKNGEGKRVGRERERERGRKGGTVWSHHEWLTLCDMHVHFSNGSICTSSSQLVIFSWEPPIIYNSRGHLQSTYTLPSRPFISSHHSLECTSLGCLEGKNWHFLLTTNLPQEKEELL